MPERNGGHGALWKDLEQLAASMRRPTPINKGGAGTHPLPQISNPVLIGVAGLGALGISAAVRTLRPKRRAGRTERFRALIQRQISADEGGAGAAIVPAGLEVGVHEAFGKPALVSVDVVLAAGALGEWSDSSEQLPAEGDHVPRALLSDLLDRVARAAWDNPEIAPVAVRGRVVLADGTTPRVLADMQTLGFDDETARPADLFERYGAPASDPVWRP